MTKMNPHWTVLTKLLLWKLYSTSIALHAVMQAQRIFCLNPKRIAIAGKIRLFCFDKTGTLTKEGLDFIGIQSVLRTGPTFEPVKSPEKGDKIDFRTLNGLATCHAVTKFGDQLVGNQVEVKFLVNQHSCPREIPLYSIKWCK